MPQKRVFVEGGIYFVTVRTFKSRKIFINPEACRLFVEVLDFCHKKMQFELFGYVILTNHIHLLIRPDDKNDISKIKYTLNKNGFKMWIIGGAVRDTVRNSIKLSKNPMNETLVVPKDFDLVTDATPDEIKKMFSGADFISNILNIGESFAIQFLVTKSHNQYELATLRSDSGGGRKPDSVQYEKTIEKDTIIG